MYLIGEISFMDEVPGDTIRCLTGTFVVLQASLRFFLSFSPTNVIDLNKECSLNIAKRFSCTLENSYV